MPTSSVDMSYWTTGQWIRSYPAPSVTTNVTNVYTTYNTTPVTPAADPKVQQDILYGRAMALSALGKARLGGNIIFGPYFNDGKVTFGVSFGVPANTSGTRVAFDIALDSQIAWRSTAGGTLPADGTFLAESFTFRFYGGTLSQSVDALETEYFPSEAIAYRPQMLLFIEDLPYARFIKPVPYVACLIGDTTGGADPDDGINVGTALERVAHSLWAGYTSSTFDTENITDTVPALLLKDNFNVVEICQSITRGYKNLDIVQADKLYVKDHGSAVFADFSFDRDNIIGGESSVLITRGEPSAQPRELELLTVDPDQDYTEATSLSKRARDPLTVSVAAGKDTFSMPLVMDASTRQAIVTYAHYYDENARKRVQFTANAEGYEIEPGDIFSMVDIADGIDNEVFKAIETTHNPDFTVEIVGEAILRCRIATEDGAAEFVNHYENANATAAQTFSSVDIGAAAADRVIVVSGGGVTNNRTVSSVTIDTGGGAEAMTVHLQRTDAGAVVGGVDVTMFVASKVVATGTTATITVTYSGALEGSFIDIYRLTNLLSTSPYATASGSGEPEDPSTTINVPSSGIVIASFAASTESVGGTIGQFSTTTWTGATKTVDEQLEGSVAWCSSAVETGLAAQTARPVSASNATEGRKSIIVSAWY